MHYCDRNFKTKKQLKEAVAARLAFLAAEKMAAATGPFTVGAMMAYPFRKANPVTVYNPEGAYEGPTPENGTVCVGGPHYPQPHTWYATVTLKDGEVVKVR